MPIDHPRMDSGSKGLRCTVGVDGSTRICPWTFARRRATPWSSGPTRRAAGRPAASEPRPARTSACGRPRAIDSIVRVGLELVPLSLAFAGALAIGRRAEGLVRSLRTGFEGLATARAAFGHHRGLHAKSVWRPPLTMAMDGKLLLYESVFKERLGSTRLPGQIATDPRWQAGARGDARSS